MSTIYEKQRKKKKVLKKTGDSQYIYQILHDKAFNSAKNPKYDGYQRVLASIVYKFFDKKTSGSGIKNKNISSKELPEELHKPIIRKF